ncbi:helix-turn-helix domain-containing protein [Kitasatospora sp. NPDC088351]|uniref:helix-turn-helix domain-containing protein n=1 Tax=Kitasatospora sp. NPDC088351 TaxID=3155180 RepID=UPI0034378C61
MVLQNPESARRGDRWPPGRSPVTPAGRPPLASGADSEFAERELGIVLRRLRLERGLSMRALARRLGYSAHSMFSDIEMGRRIPSEALVGSYEETFGLPPGSLLVVRQRAMAGRARRMTAGADPRPAGAGQGGAGQGGADQKPLSDAVARLAVAVLSRTRSVVGRWIP